MKCKNCGEEIAKNCKYCECCGTKVSGEIGGHTILWLCLVGLLLGGGAVAFSLFKQDRQGMINVKADVDDENSVINTINTYNNACSSNDFYSLSNVYSENVIRFHDAYNLSNAEVVGKFRKYDSIFGVYGKHFNVRWNTLQIEQLPDEELSVVYVEEYSIDRVDKSKYSIFVLEEHLILDKDYRIKSIYEVQLSKMRK
jgi:hypothetical protein